MACASGAAISAGMGKTGLLPLFLFLAVFQPARAVERPSSPARPVELVVFETASCVWCAKWQRDVGTGYPGTRAAQAMPLRRIDLLRPVPADVAGLSVGAMPTFVLRQCGREIGRIVGYSTPAVFWNKLGALARKLGPESC
jgi:hypothetical protein